MPVFKPNNPLMIKKILVPILLIVLFLGCKKKGKRKATAVAAR